MKPAIFQNTTKEKVMQQLPGSLRILIENVSLEDYKFFLAVFPVDNRKVITGASAEKTVGLSNQTNIHFKKFVLGSKFTVEANEIFTVNNFTVLGIDIGFWTDERFHNIRQGKI